MERKVKFIPKEYYHLYSRGVEKRKIFIDKKDYERFMALLYIMNQSDKFHFNNFLKNKELKEVFDEKKDNSLVLILSYTLMPNHFHILVYEKEKDGISKFMSRLLTAYSMYFNKKYQRSGPLFTHPFRSQHISDESQYLWIFSYIHLNPVKMIEKDFKEQGIKNKNMVQKFLETYKYSSYIDYKNKERTESKIIDISMIPDYVKNVDFNLEEYNKYQG